MEKQDKQDSLWSMAYIRLLLVQVISAFSFYMIVTVLVTYLTGASVGATAAVAGVVSGLFSITSFVCRPFCGVITDRWNRMRLLQVATLMMAVGCLGYAVSGSMVLIVAARIIHGVGFAINSTALVAMATQLIPASRMGEGIGYIGVANTIASAAAPGIGIGIANRFGITSVFYVAGVLAFIALLALLTMSSEQQQKPVAKGRIHFEDVFAVSVLGYCVLGGIFSFTNGVISSYLLSYSKLLGLENVGLYFTLNALVLFLVRPFAGRLMDRAGLKVLTYPGLFITAVSMFMLATAAYWPILPVVVIVASGIVRAIGQGSVNPALQTECIHHLGIEKSGVATSSFYLGGDIGQGLGPMIAGAVIGLGEYEIKYYNAMFFSCGILLLLSMILFFFVQRRMERAERV